MTDPQQQALPPLPDPVKIMPLHGRRYIAPVVAFTREQVEAIQREAFEAGRALAASAPSREATVKQDLNVPSGWKLVPEELSTSMIHKAQTGTEIGAYIAANWAGAYGCFDELWRAWLSATPSFPSVAAEEKKP